MTLKVFLTGASGYIGGEVLYQISRLDASHQVRCLVRDKGKGAAIKETYPKVEVVEGDLDNASLVESEAKAADVVLHLASTRHDVSTRAIVKGLNDTGRQKAGYWLQISGASLFAGPQIKAGTYGEAEGKTYDDIADVEEIRAVIRASPGRIIDNLVLDQDQQQVKTALVPGPIIYGKGRGPGNTRTVQGPTIAEYTIKNGESFQIGKGENIWSTIHVADVAKLFVSLLSAAADGLDDVWNTNGVFLPENGQIAFGEFAQLISKAARDQGLIKSDNIRSFTGKEIDQIVPHGSIILGTVAKLSSSRAQKYLGWKPTEVSLVENISRMVAEEAERLQDQGCPRVKL